MGTRLLTAMAAMSSLSTGVAAAQASPSPTVLPAASNAAAPLVQDATAYAALFGLSQADAEHRLQAQEATVAFTDEVKATYRSRLAGIAVEQRSVLQIDVLLIGPEPVSPHQVAANGLAVPIVFRTGAAATLDELQEALKTKQAAIRAALAHPPGMGIDQRSGELVILVAAADADAEDHDALTARLAAITGVPVHVRSIDRPSVDQAAEGGARLVGSRPGDSHRYLCTAGFAVTDGQRDGIATAAHCPDELDYVDAGGQAHAMPFVGQWGWGYQDVQINASDEPLTPYFFADTNKTVSRPVLTQRSASSMRAGDLVCHRGERTGYSCGTVELTSFAPAGDLCGGACSPTWITVSGPHCGGGDSGAPVFIGSTALGILTGGSYRADGSCGFYFYMSLDYLPTGWQLLTALPADDIAR